MKIQRNNRFSFSALFLGAALLIGLSGASVANAGPSSRDDDGGTVPLETAPPQPAPLQPFYPPGDSSTKAVNVDPSINPSFSAAADGNKVLNGNHVLSANNNNSLIGGNFTLFGGDDVTQLGDPCFEDNRNYNTRIPAGSGNEASGFSH